ncbi:DUF3592 domain-containing protein [Streptomyces sp. L2]|uniref:DUF3592 domain-containing protein n=1 Tax=Streptomyces sp. L2 TaxID=2162665 RepID=UPI001011ADF0|nr:DUF3592 domain-containing protein [Streptomyces sp. L2]
MWEPGGPVDLAGIFFVFLGTCGLLIQAQSFVDYRRLRRLERHGIEGEATIVRTAPGRGLLLRCFFAVKLPGDEAGGEFCEVLLEPMGSPGDVVAAIYDPSRPERAKTGTRGDIEYKGERLAVYLLGGGGGTLFVAGLAMIFTVRGW